jgi:hypothetical protein
VQAQQFPSTIWHSGKMVTIEGDTLKGLIKYNLDLDLIQIQVRNGRLKTYSAKKLYYFEIFDETVDNFRYFYSLPFAQDSNYEVPMLFEVIHEGKMSLLSREKIVTETFSQYSYYSPSYVTRQTLGYDFYFLKEGSVLKQYFAKKNELESVFMKDRANEVSEFIKANRLEVDEKADLLRIVYFYNSLI